MPDPPVRELLLAALDQLIEGLHRALDAVVEITDQLEPDGIAALGPARQRDRGSCASGCGAPRVGYLADQVPAGPWSLLVEELLESAELDDAAERRRRFSDSERRTGICGRITGTH